MINTVENFNDVYVLTSEDVDYITGAGCSAGDVANIIGGAFIVAGGGLAGAFFGGVVIGIGLEGCAD